MKKRNWLILVTVALVFNSCAMNVAQKNEARPENSKVVVSTSRTPQVRDAPPSANSNLTVVSNLDVAEKKTGDAQKFDCSQEIKGVSKAVKIPKELCFDETQPADKSEVVPDPPPGVRQANTLSSDTIAASKVPAEVLRVIELIKGSKSVAKRFQLIVSSNGEDSTTPKRAIKVYLYSPITDNNEAGGTFYFQKQKGKLKLVLADI